MNFLKLIENRFFFLLTFLLGVQTLYAKTELIVTQNHVSFPIEKTHFFTSLEKARFVIFDGVSAQNQHKFSEYFVSNVANAPTTAKNNFYNFVADVVNDYTLAVVHNGNTSNLLTIERNSDGFYLKGTISDGASSGTECFTIENIRFRNSGSTQIEEGALKVFVENGSFVVRRVVNVVDDVAELTVSTKNHLKLGDVKITIKNSQTGADISETTRRVTDPPINVPSTGANIKIKVTGIHFENILTQGLVEEISGTRTLVTTLQDGTEVYQSKIKVWVQEANNGQGLWKVLKDEKTWWPSLWPEQKVWSRISEAFNNKVHQYNNLYHGITEDGTKIAMRLDELGNIDTAYIIQ